MKLGDHMKIGKTDFWKKIWNSRSGVICVEKYLKIDSIGLKDFANIGNINEANDTLSNRGGPIIWKSLDFEFWMMSYRSFGSFSLLVCIYVCLCIRVFSSVCLFVCLFVLLFVHLFICLFLCLLLCLHLFVCSFVHLFV